MTDGEFENIMRRQINPVLQLACSYLKCTAEAEDCAQEVFLKLYRSDIYFGSEKEERADMAAALCIPKNNTIKIYGRGSRIVAKFSAVYFICLFILTKKPPCFHRAA